MKISEPVASPLNHNTLFDMASLTKVLATAPLAMIFTDKGLISLADKASDYLSQFSGEIVKEIKIGRAAAYPYSRSSTAMFQISIFRLRFSVYFVPK